MPILDFAKPNDVLKTNDLVIKNITAFLETYYLSETLKWHSTEL